MSITRDRDAVFISISVDLVGSTALKRAMVQVSGEDRVKLGRLYERYVTAMFEIEESIYRFTAVSRTIDIRNLFLAKIIGDEYWYLYQIDPANKDETARIVTAFVHGLLGSLAEERSFDFGAEMPARKGARERHFDLSIKILIDVIKHNLDLPSRRHAHFESKIMDFLRAESRMARIDPHDYATVCHMLNFRPAKPTEVDLLSTARSDYVGMQIDRFFRVAKSCKPRLLTVGQELWALADGVSWPIDQGLNVERFIQPTNDMNLPPLFCNASREMLRGRELAGIDDDYEVFHLYNQRTLREDIYRPKPGLNDFLAPTRTFLARSGFYGLSPEQLAP